MMRWPWVLGIEGYASVPGRGFCVMPSAFPVLGLSLA